MLEEILFKNHVLSYLNHIPLLEERLFKNHVLSYLKHIPSFSKIK
jgi:hypothetical protein